MKGLVLLMIFVCVLVDGFLGILIINLDVMQSNFKYVLKKLDILQRQIIFGG